METVLVFLVLISFSAMIAGLVRPSAVRVPTRGKALRNYGFATLAFFILFAVIADPVETDTTASTKQGDQAVAVTVPAEHTGKTYQIQTSAGDTRSLLYRTSKRGEIVLLELYSDKIVFTALISRGKFEEVMALKPPTYFSYQGADYVRNNGLLFWGEKGRPESVSVDGKPFDGFVLVNNSQISAEGDAARNVLDAMRSGSRVKLEKHYWNSNNEKAFPIFDLDSVHDGLGKLGPSSASTFTVNEGQTRCRQEGPRKIVWIETAKGTFALNGQAMDVVEKSAASGSPWLDSGGRPLQVGRDVLGPEVARALIEAGLRKCN